MRNVCIKSAFQNNKIKTRNTIFSVQSSSVILRDLTLPVAEDSQLTGAVAYEMEQYVSVDGKDTVMEYRVVDEVIEEGVSKNKIKVATMPKDMIDNYFSFAREIKKKPYILDINSNAVSKIFAGELDINDEKYIPEKSIAIVDFGYKTTNINIITNGALEFSRLLSYGNRDIDAIISNYYNITPGEAEIKKIEEIQLDIIEDDIEDPDSIYAALKASINQLIRELQKVLQYYSSRSSNNNLDTMYIYGGGSRIKGLDAYLKQTLNLENVVKIESLFSPDYEIAMDGIKIDDYINALGAMVRL